MRASGGAAVLCPRLRSLLLPVSSGKNMSREPNALVVRAMPHHDLHQALLQPDDSNGFVMEMDPTTRIRHVLRPVLRQLARMHAVGAAHRDLKPANVVLGPEGGGVLIDFGHFLPDATSPCRSCSLFTGTVWYRAPELLFGRCGSEAPFGAIDWLAADVWSCGLLLAIAACPWYIFMSDSEHHCVAYHARYLGVPVPIEYESVLRSFPVPDDAQQFSLLLEHVEYEVGPDLVHLLRGMLELDPRKRITAEEAISHKFWQSSDPVLPLPGDSNRRLPVPNERDVRAAVLTI